MKRMHLHVAVDNLAEAIEFYATLFAARPTVTQPDYAKWMLDDPRVNFAVSARGAPRGLNHLGVQVESAAELAEMNARLEGIAGGVVTEPGTTCCYARSDKSWSTDPAGIAWETFHTLESVPVFSEQTTACCVPDPGGPRADADTATVHAPSRGCC